LRMLSAMSAFQCLQNKGQNWSVKTRPLPVQDVFEGMCLVLKKHMADGVLDDLEVAQCVACMMDGVDMHDGAVSVDEFVKTATSNEILDISHVAQLFDDQRKRGVMERLFDDTPKEIHVRRRQIRQVAGAEVNKILSSSSSRPSEETRSRDSSEEMQELYGPPSALTQTIKIVVEEALGDLPVRLEKLEMEVKVLRNSKENVDIPRVGVPLKEKTQTCWLQNSDDLEDRISRLEVACLDDVWSRATKDLEARVSCLEDGLHQRVDANTSKSYGAVKHPTRQLSRWSDISLDLANSASAYPEGAVHPSTDSSHGRLQPGGSKDATSCVQEVFLPEHPRELIIPIPSFPAHTVPATMGQPQRPKWRRRTTSHPRNSRRSDDTRRNIGNPAKAEYSNT